MKLAIMQPYFFPYIGYFQLIRAVDKFIFYDDVNFIKNGWINRNKIIINGKVNYFTIPLKGASPNKLINEVEFIDDFRRIKKTILQNYKKSPYFNDVWPVIEDCFNLKTNLVSVLSIYSVRKICEYLNLDTVFEQSSVNYPETKVYKKERRLIEICKQNNADTYINPIGGIELYKKDDFSKEGIKLFFIKMKDIHYRRFDNNVFPTNLSIVDVIMFNSREEVKKMLNEYELI